VENGVGLLTVREALGAMRHNAVGLGIFSDLPKHHTKS
jgi:hypothetical protein